MDVTKYLFMGATGLSCLSSATIFGLSFVGVPTVLITPYDSLALTQWRSCYDLGIRLGPLTAGSSALCSALLAYTLHHPQAPNRTVIFGLASLSSLCIAPWTLLVMLPTNKRLFAKEDAGRKKEKDGAPPVAKTEETVTLIKKWQTLNYIRSVFPLVGAILAYEAL